MKTKFYLLASAVCMAGPLASPAWAQNAEVSGGAAEQQVQTPAGDPASSTTETNAGTDGQAALPPAAGTGTAGGEIVVTGSRLGNSGYSAPTPVSVLGAEAIETRAPSAVAELVNQIPSFRQSTGPSQGQRFLLNSAQSLLDLRGLGSSRTLLLIDGRRQVTSDTNVIPVSLVERIEVVTGGASAAYGSDAVAGVANFVLKHRLNGIQGTVQNAISDEGDNQTFTVNLAAGTSLADDRLHLIAGLDYSDNKGVGTIRSRKWSNVNPANVAGGATRPAGLAAQNFLTDVSFSAQTPGGVIVSGPLRNTAFGPGGSTYAFQQGTVYSNLMVGGDNDAANPNNNFPLQTPVERLATLARAEYDISDNATFFVEGAFSRVKANGYTSFAQFPSIIIQSGNPFIPANVQAQMTALGLPSITVGRTFTELGGYGINTDRKTYRGVAGFTGKLLKDFTWNASYQYSRSREKAVIGGTFVQALVLQAANAQRDASGNIVCGPVATNPNLTAATRDQIALFQSINPGATCAPFNVFGQGSPSASSLDYIQGAGIANRNITTSTSQIASADISGSPFSTWAGPVQLAFGGEYRKETLRNVPDPIGEQGLFIAGSNGLFSGSRNVKEGFVELGVPLAADVPFAKLLDLNAAYRYTSYSLSGSVSTWKVGAVYEPVEFLRLRATRSRDIRAPNLFELFQTGTRSIVASILNPLNGRTGTLVTLATGNTDLSPEIANTWTVGAVLQPKSGALSRLRASVDYFSIKLDDAITSVSAAEILRRCAAGAQEFCAAVTQDSSTFGLAQVQLQPFNLNQLSTRGLDIEVTYRAPLSGAGLPGSFVLRGLASHVFSLKTTDSSGTIDRAGSLQSNGVPRWTGTVDVGYDSDAFNATLTTRFFSSVLFDAGLIGPEQDGYSSTLVNSINKNKLPSRTYFDLALNMDVLGQGRDRASLFLIVKNLLDKNPPVESLFINSGGNPYDLVGRTFTAGLRFRF